MIDAPKLTTSTAYAPARPDRGDEQPADRRPDDRGRLEVELVQGDRRRQPLRRDQPRDRRRTGRLVHRGEPSRDEGHREEQPERRAGVEGDDHQGQAARREAGLGHEQEAPPVDRIGHRAGPQREDEDRDELGEGQGADRQGRVGLDVDLVGQRDPGDLGAHPGHHLAAPEEPVVTVLPERRGVDEQAAETPAHRPGRLRACRTGRRSRPVRRGYLSRSAGFTRAAWAAASRATGTRNGEHET